VAQVPLLLSTTPGSPRNIEKHGLEKFNAFLADVQVSGTPDQVTEKAPRLRPAHRRWGLLTILSFGAMPPEEARANFDLYVREVLPVLRRHDVGGDLGVT
jgi:hypothetical protein